MTQDEIKALELEALIEDLRLNHEYCPKEVILQAADELERLSQRTEQKPIAWMSPSWIDPNTRGWQSDSFESIPIEGWLPIYTTPPQRSESSGKPSAWVGLTNEELTDLFYNTNLGQQSAVAQAIALLKEKNT
jgi:hypothetical protein